MLASQCFRLEYLFHRYFCFVQGILKMCSAALPKSLISPPLLIELAPSEDFLGPSWLQRLVCSSSGMYIFAFEPHQTKHLLHHTCHSTSTWPKTGPKVTQSHPHIPQVTPKWPPSASKVATSSPHNCTLEASEPRGASAGIARRKQFGAHEAQ